MGYGRGDRETRSFIAMSHAETSWSLLVFYRFCSAARLLFSRSFPSFLPLCQRRRLSRSCFHLVPSFPRGLRILSFCCPLLFLSLLTSFPFSRRRRRRVCTLSGAALKVENKQVLRSRKLDAGGRQQMDRIRAPRSRSQPNFKLGGRDELLKAPPDRPSG